MSRNFSCNPFLNFVVRFIARLIALAAMAVASQAVTVHFAKAVPYNLDGHANAVAVADVNGDGNPDLVVATDGDVSVLLGNGDGTFRSPLTYGPGGALVAIGDINGDGKPDIVVSASYVSVLLGNGDGTFQSPMTYSTGGWSVAIADVNGDGKLDLVLGNFPNSWHREVSVMLGNGDGTFQTIAQYDTGGFDTLSVAVADVNGDGYPDVVAADVCGNAYCTSHGVVSVLLGNGDGTFGAAATYDSGGYYAWSVAVADVNGDSKPDVVVGNGVAGPTVLLNRGDGTFQIAWQYNLGGGDAVAIGDLNGDGKPDLVVSVPGAPPYLKVQVGNGDGGFQSPVKYGSGGWDPSSVTIADLNRDGKPDLVVVNYCLDRVSCHYSGIGGTVSVRLNNFTAKTTVQLSSTPNPSLISQTVTLTAAVTADLPVPNGEVVTFYAGTNKIGTGTTVSGVATLSTSFGKTGTYIIKARYGGDSFHKASSGNVKQVVNK